jgi:hypothetical protein
VVVRTLFAMCLAIPLVFGALEAVVFGATLVRPDWPHTFLTLAFGCIGTSSLFVSLWALWRIRTLEVWKLASYTLLSSVLAALGFGLVVGAAH